MFKIPKTLFVLACLNISMLYAQDIDWPTKPIRVVYPYAAGGVGDAIFRVIGPALEGKFGQRFIVDNKTGADGKIGTLEVVNAKPDGYTLLMAPTANYSVNQHLFANLGYDPIALLEPISLIAEAPLIAVTSMAGPNSLKDFAQQASSNTNKFNYGSPGTGSPPQLAGALFSQLAGNSIEHIAYRGTPPMVMAMVGGDIQLAFGSWSAVGTQIKAGKIKPLATTGSQRFEEILNVPTTKEAGYPDLTITNWWILSAPKNIDPKIIQKLYAELKIILNDAQIKTKLLEIGHTSIGLGPKESAAFIRSESTKYKNLILKNAIKVYQ